ncbi:MAG: hypothetical protein N2652_03875 [Kiritimatiellae bacterium]|nr:hypothetical protein [Kiritimatiellia bacterium]
MNQPCRRTWVAFSLGVAATVCAANSTSSPPARAGGMRPDQRYAWLALTNLPPVEVFLATVTNAEVETTDESHWRRRMRRAAWVPRLEVRYGMAEQGLRRYGFVMRPVDGLDSYGIGDEPEWLNAWEVGLVWDFSLRVFRPEEIDAHRARIEAERVRLDRQTAEADLRSRVILAYYELVEALRLLQMDTYRDSVPTWIRKERAAATLDDLTRGALSRLAPPPAGGR